MRSDPRELVGKYDLVSRYKGNNTPYERPGRYGCTSIDVLPELIGLPFDDFALMWLETVSPDSIRVSDGCVKCDSWTGRVTVYLDENKKIKSISKEVNVGGGSGWDMKNILRELKRGLAKKDLSENDNWKNPEDFYRELP